MGDFDPATERFARITNRHGLQVFVKLVEPAGEARGNVYLAHGFSDVHDTPHMRALTAAWVRAGYNVVVWDATHSWGRSEGCGAAGVGEPGGIGAGAQAACSLAGAGVVAVAGRGRWLGYQAGAVGGEPERLGIYAQRLGL
jgi:predicted alpha/beta-hydrolase family hydrolase